MCFKTRFVFSVTCILLHFIYICIRVAFNAVINNNNNNNNKPNTNNCRLPAFFGANAYCYHADTVADAGGDDDDDVFDAGVYVDCYRRFV